MFKYCVILSTYHRKDGSTKGKLTKILQCIEEQTYKNFKVFVVGDDYANNEEFEEICKNYKGDIYYFNNPTSYRSYKFAIEKNYWAIGGTKSLIHGIERAINEDFNFYFHVDDDDFWKPNHIECVVNAIEKLPDSDFIYTRSIFWDKYYVPFEHEDIKMDYNNHCPLPGHVCHSASVYNLKSSFGQFVLDDLKKYDKLADDYNGIGSKEANQWKINLKFKTLSASNHIIQKEEEMDPGDMRCLKQLSMFKNKYNYKTVYVPEITVIKETDGNYVQL